MSQVPSLTPNFTDVALKIWAYIFFAFGGGISRGSPKSKILALQKSEYSRFWFDMYSVLSTQRAIQIVMYVCKTVSQLQLTSDRLYFSAFLHHHLWQTRDPLLRGRSAFVYHESFVDRGARGGEGTELCLCLLLKLNYFWISHLPTRSSRRGYRNGFLKCAIRNWALSNWVLQV